YEDKDVWLTYGNYEPFPSNTGQSKATAYPPEVIAERSFRSAAMCFNHPLTFRQHLWARLAKTDLQHSNGQWFRSGYDMVIMMALLELAANGHFRFIDEILYAYTAINPLSEVVGGVAITEEES